MNISDRRRSLNTTVMLFVVFLALQAATIYPGLEESLIAQGLAVVLSKGIYELIIGLIFWLISSSSTLMHIYWGRLYLDGLWSYEYSLNGKTFFGVWDISQTTEGIKVIGNGLDDNYRVRTIVRSVSPLIEEQGGYFVLNARNELSNDNARVFSKTTLLLDHPRRPWQIVMSMRATTEIFGGPSDRQLHPNVVFTRHPRAKSVEDVAKALQPKHSEIQAGHDGTLLEPSRESDENQEPT